MNVDVRARKYWAREGAIVIEWTPDAKEATA